MTIEQCAEAAKKRLIVTHDGIVYLRISRISKVYPADTSRKPYYVVELEDKCLHSITEADPAKVKIYERESRNEKEKMV